VTRDPIVDETRRARQKLLAECDDQLDRLLDRFKAAEEAHRDRVVTLESLREKRKHKQTEPGTR
jgi:molybdenum-dependent DNA-binding transcriptional regulator ModE